MLENMTEGFAEEKVKREQRAEEIVRYAFEKDQQEHLVSNGIFIQGVLPRDKNYLVGFLTETMAVFHYEERSFPKRLFDEDMCEIAWKSKYDQIHASAQTKGAKKTVRGKLRITSLVK